MIGIDDRKSRFDAYKDLRKLTSRIYKTVKPVEREVQHRLTRYNPKPYGTKKTYPQNWVLYGIATSQEKLMFFTILQDAVDHLLIEHEYKGNGRPAAFYGDIVKSLCIKSYHGYSSWTLESELHIAQAMGIIDIVHKRSTLNKYLQSAKIGDLLDKLYKTIAEPLKDVEAYFATDATGISASYGNTSWMKLRRTKEEKKHRKEFRKLYIITGCKTNCVCAAKVTEGTEHESPHFKGLLKETAKVFNIKELSADAGYLSRENVEAISKIGSVPFIMGRKNVNVPIKGRASAWGAMLRLWKKHQMFFAEHYHRRSNVESTFSMLKRKHGAFCRAKKPISQENEILCKIVCHNAVVLAEALLSYDLRGGFLNHW